MRHQDAKSGRQAAIVNRRLRRKYSQLLVIYLVNDGEDAKNDDGGWTFPIELRGIPLQGRQVVRLSGTRWLES